MSAIRILAGLGAAALLVLAARGYERRNISRLNLIILFGLCASVAALAIYPPLFDPILRTFDFERGTDGVIFALLVAVFVLFFLYLRAQTTADTNERSIRLLVEALGQERFDWDRAESLPDGQRLVTICPAFNEAENVAAVIKQIPAMIEGHHVVPVVVSDGSTDGTAAVAREAGAYVAELPIRRGGGLALRVGYEIALQLGAQIVVTLDSDGQHLPEEIPIVIAPILAGEADYVNGSRLLGSFERESLVRHLGVHVFSRIITLLTGRRITDPSSGYRAARADLLERVVLKQDQFWSTEILIEALRNRARVVEVPVTFLARAGGESKKPKSFRYGWNFLKVIIQTWLR
ncbi:MAG TPA: glycosyltransferase family 2 protein [Actinomycetota bacterium]|nr:glycosyltransferase family 2 protein [Actinomycetota bacterium]